MTETKSAAYDDFENELQYTGAIYDKLTRLLYLNARFYDPSNGRFITQDSYRGERTKPDTWHLYLYCANDPINYVDPTGHFPRSVLAFGIDVVFNIVTYGLSAKIGAAIHLIKKEVLGSNIKSVKQLLARNTSKLKTKINSLYYKYFQKTAKKLGLVKIARNLKNKVSWLKRSSKLNNKAVVIVSVELKTSAIGNLIGKFTNQLKCQNALETINIFSSVGNLLAALIEVDVDNNLNGDIGS